MKLIFVHGMSQEGKDPEELKRAWQDALNEGCKAAGLPAPAATVSLPYYGDELHKLTESLRGQTTSVIPKGGSVGAQDQFEVDLLRTIADRAGVTDEDIRAEAGQEVVARGPANWEWVQGLVRALERKIPGLSEPSLRLVRQVDAYLSRPHIQDAVDAIVEPELTVEPMVVVSHSLGTIVSYKLLRSSKLKLNVPLFVTLGSPLGIDIVKARISPPTLKVPEGVKRWINGTDERDYVALHSLLNRDTFAEGIENISDIHNRREDAHSISDYLADKAIAGAIAHALDGV